MTRFLYTALIIGALGSFSQANACSYCGYSMYSGDPMYNGYAMYGADPMYNSYAMYSTYPMFNVYPMYSSVPMYSEYPFYSSFMMGGVPFPMFDGISNPIPLYMIDQNDVALRHPESAVIGY